MLITQPTRFSTFERVQDENGKRWYKCGEQMYPSVTTVLDCINHIKLQNYFKNNSKAKIEKVRAETADFGSKLHHLIEMDLKGTQVKIDHDGLRKCFENWTTVKKEKSISATHTELVVVSHKYGFAGSADIIGSYNGKTCVMDLKTGWYGVKAGYQMAAYRQAAIEMGIVDKSCGLAGIQIHRDGSKVATFEYEHIDFCFRRFLYALECFKGLYFNEISKMNAAWLKTDAVETYFGGNND